MQYPVGTEDVVVAGPDGRERRELLSPRKLPATPRSSQQNISRPPRRFDGIQ
jgi:hypothetical protein